LSVKIAGYSTSRSSPFVSLQDGRGCSSVAKSFSGQYLASIDGYWEGQNGFSYNLALYQFSFNNLQSTETNFYELITSITGILGVESQQTKEQNLAQNIILLQAESLRVVKGSSVQALQYTPVPGYVYQRATITVGFSSAQEGVCPYSTQGYFQSNNAMLSTTVKNSSFVQYCGSSTSLEVLGFNPLLDNTELQLFMDFNTIVSIIAINTNVLNISDYELIHLTSELATNSAFSYNGVNYVANQYYNPSFPGMAPMVCLEADVGYSFCLFRINGYFFLPISNSLGGPLTYSGIPQYCNW
jgi:hypothetical protein